MKNNTAFVALLAAVLLLLLFVFESSHAFTLAPAFHQSLVFRTTQQQQEEHKTSALYMAKKRGKGLRRNIGESGGAAGMGGGSTSSSSSARRTTTTSRTDINWCPMPANQKKKMPTVDGKVALLDTQLPTMKNSATNPTGAVGVAKFAGQTYCFSSSCPCCQIPLTKAQILEPVRDDDESSSDGHPRLSCDFCKSTYSLGTGQKVPDSQAPKAGLLGGVVKSVFSVNKDNTGPLKLYKLGEKGNGQLVIAVD